MESRIFSCRLLCSTFLAFCFEARWCSFSLALKAGICLAEFFSFANTPGFFRTFCFEVRWCSFSLALNAGLFNLFSADYFANTPGFFLAIALAVHSFSSTSGFFLAIALAAHSFSSIPGFFLAFCFEVRWFSFSLTLNAGFCLANFFQHILLLIHLFFSDFLL